MWLHIDAMSSLLASAGLAAAFVGSLYIWKQSEDKTRDHPDVIKQRFISLGGVCLLSPLILWLWANERTPSGEIGGPPFGTWIGFPAAASWTTHVIGTLLPLLLTAILFAGPIGVGFAQTFFWSSAATESGHHNNAFADGSSPVYNGTPPAPSASSGAVSGSGGWFKALCHRLLNEHWSTSALQLQTLRNLVVAPICEEFVYRAVIITLLVGGGWSFSTVVFASPLLFGLAHLHHLIGLVRQRGYTLARGLVVVGFQLCYTTVFGWLAGFLYVRTGFVTAPIVSHAFCNMMGVPDLSFMRLRDHPLYERRHLFFGLHVIGLIAFFLLLFPLTDPLWYGGPEDCCFLMKLMAANNHTTASTSNASATTV